MENVLRNHLRTCAEAFAAAKGLEIVTVGRLAANDWRFFERLNDAEKTFTVRTYDRVMSYFSDNWPEGVDWPEAVPRPVPPPPGDEGHRAAPAPPAAAPAGGALPDAEAMR